MKINSFGHAFACDRCEREPDSSIQDLRTLKEHGWGVKNFVAMGYAPENVAPSITCTQCRDMNVMKPNFNKFYK